MANARPHTRRRGSGGSRRRSSRCARVAERLVAAGILEEQRRRRLGVFETTRYPEPERRLRAALTDVLVTGREPTAREAMLIALLSAYDLVKRVVPRDDRRAAGKRAKAIARAT